MYVSVSVRVVRSEDCGKMFSSFTVFVKSLNYVHHANRSNLVTASWNFVVLWKHAILVDEHVLAANLSLSANRDAWW